MASVLKLKTDIKKLKAAIASKATSGAIKTKLRGKLTSLENELDKLQPNKRKPKTTGPKSESALVKLAKKRRSKQGLSTSKSDIERDAIRPAKPAGKRISASGNVYYEYRDNRVDTRQPPKKYRKLADGGSVDKYLTESEYIKIEKKLDELYGKNVDKNYIHIFDLWTAYTELPENDLETSFNKETEMAEALVNTFEEHGWNVDMPHGRYKVKLGYKFKGGGYMADGGVVKVVEDAYGKSAYIPYKGEQFLLEWDTEKPTKQSTIISDRSFRTIDNDSTLYQTLLVTLLKAMHDNKVQYAEKGAKLAMGGKTKEQEVVRGYFEDEAYEYADGGMIAKLKKQFASKDLDDDLNMDGYHVEIFDWKEESEKDRFIKNNSKDNYLVPWDSDDDNSYIVVVPKNKMDHGGSVAKGNYEMLLSQAKEVMHHAEELMQVAKPDMDIEAWVVAKAERATTDLSDITHYLDGLKMAMGGMVKHNAHKVNA